MIQALKDFKEIVGVIVLVGGAIAWVAAYVATKSQVAEVRCLMQAQIDLLRSQTEQSLITSQLIDVTARLDRHTSRASGTVLSDADRKDAAELSVSLESLKKQRTDAEAKRREVEAMLQRNGCAPQ